MMRAMQRYSFRHIFTPDGMLHDRTLAVGPDGRIAGIGPAAPGARFDGWLALPGIPNAHSHAFQRALAGYGEAPSAAGRDSFWSWREAMYRLALRVTPEQCGAIARHAYAEMLAAGYTSVAEFHYLHHGVDGARGTEMAAAVVEAARAAGIRLTLLPVLYMQGSFDQPARAEQRRFVHARVDEFLGSLQRLVPIAAAGGARLGVAPHSLRAVPARELPSFQRDARALLGDDAPFHIHVAEQIAEVEACHAAHGCGPIELLARSVELDARWSLVHATHADARERALLRKSEATLVICPLTEAYLGDGLYPVEEHRGEAVVGIAIGSDSNCRIDAFEELRLLEHGARLRNRARAQLADARGLGCALWSGAVAAGARALAQPCAGIAVGQLADLVVVPEQAPALAGHGIATALDALVINGAARDVGATFVGGRRIGPADTRAAYDAAVKSLLP
jgi:formimidoylglutamate deiminase